MEKEIERGKNSLVRLTRNKRERDTRNIQRRKR
jgi:hypothetical protein